VRVDGNGTEIPSKDGAFPSPDGLETRQDKVMNTTLAIYDALVQAKIPADAARAVVDALEKDMTTLLATKQDFRHFEELFSARMESLESRLIIKLGALMTILFGSAAALVSLLAR
jgi:hypothetical protein